MLPVRGFAGGTAAPYPVEAGMTGEDRVPKVKKSYYEVLGVAPFSHARIIEETYWERAHELHSVPTRKAQQRLRVLNEAYEVLASPHKRAEYDRHNRRQAKAERNGQGGGLFQQFLSVLGKPFRPD